MIEKEITFDYETNDLPMYLINDSTMVKQAFYAPEIQEAIDRLEKKIDHVYVLVNALSAGEYFGPNRNGDFFPEKELIEHHKTYETLGFQYRRHDNKDPKKSFGKVIFAWYNPEMRRVEIIVELPVNKNRDILERLERGQPVFSSMGCKVPYDVCSICGNKAKTRAQYCDHLKIMMGRTLSDGRRVYAINVRPKFFDNSWVDRPAEATAGVLAKIASDMSEDNDKVADEKEATIKKEIPAEIDNISSDPKNLLVCSQKRIPDKILSKIAEYNDGEILTTLISLRVAPSSSEFEKLGIEDVFARAEKPNIKIAEELKELLPSLVLTKPLAISRFTKTADVIVENVSDIYKKFVIDFNKASSDVVKLAASNPWLFNIWVDGDLGNLETQKMLTKQGSAVKNIMIDIPDSYITEGNKTFEGSLPELSKTAESISPENLFKMLSEDSLNYMYNSILNWEE